MWLRFDSFGGEKTVNNLKIACFVVIMLMASGCSRLGHHDYGAIPTGSGGFVGATAASTVQPIDGHQITRAYLFPNMDLLPKDNLPNAAIILREEDGAFNDKICESFVTQLPDEAWVLTSNQDAKAISTYWLLTGAAENLRECSFLQGAYDYERAEELSQTYLGKALEGPALLYVEPDGRFVWAYLDLSDPVASAQALENWYGTFASQDVELNAAPTAAKSIFTFGKPNTPGATMPTTDPRLGIDGDAPEATGQGAGPKVATGIVIVDLGYNLFCSLPFDKPPPNPTAVAMTGTANVSQKKRGIIGFVSGVVRAGRRVANSVHSAVC